MNTTYKYLSTDEVNKIKSMSKEGLLQRYYEAFIVWLGIDNYDRHSRRANERASEAMSLIKTVYRDMVGNAEYVRSFLYDHEDESDIQESLDR